MTVTVNAHTLKQVPTTDEFNALDARVAALEVGGSSGASQVFFRQHSGHQDLFRDFQMVSNLTVTFTVSAPSKVILSGHLDAANRDLINDAIMVAAQAKINGAWMDGSKTGGNIISPTHHYLMMPLAGYAEVAAGEHTVEVFARSASSAAPNTDGLAELKPDYNAMIVRVEPI